MAFAAFSALACFAPAVGFAATAVEIAKAQPQIPEDKGLSGASKRQLEDALQALKNSKRVDRIEAERVLASISAFREARQSRQPPQPLDTALKTCVASPMPVCLLEEALAHAYRVPDVGRRDWALSSVASAFYEAGEEHRVYGVLALMDDPRVALRLLGETLGRPAGKGGAVESAAAEMPDTETGDTENGHATGWTLAVSKSDWKTAQALIQSIKEPRYRAVAWARFARSALDDGKPELADEALASSETTIAKITLSYARSFARYEAALTHIARVAQNSGRDEETRKAVAAAALIDQPHFRADAYWRLADVGAGNLASEIDARAEASFAEIGSRLRKVFVLTGKEAKNAEWQDRALAIAASITDPLDRARAFTRLARYVR